MTDMTSTDVDSPLTVRQYALQSTVDGVVTEFLAMAFSTHILLLISQTGKIGSMFITATDDSGSGGVTAHDLHRASLSGQVLLLGRQEGPQGLVYDILVGEVSDTVKRAATREQRPLLLGLALKPVDPRASDAFRTLTTTILDGIEACRVW
ncbi:hypothetical protein BJ684DRAFT_19286 [Piptocephalis cylindrospora]|uniref:Proteasome assembly chaperone 3 n=1 Tax=Piptocephalis cylindrospora TaxID=1907219 RepID=A0A4P9Y5K8_9FUNG|nr:hypothetical protein BJ684DRAFT_19286 [Piptocephalis cylindrospora]|eukprot:RKP14296.1 hypothetical protein BJ684DRAFT_19286 [Piptocephalis cylindrospora]